ncbi:MAG: 50S ribosomal protein L4 [Magnetococcales bacterium]|nr:50S ribosomal protein L4 [Magnetococcales bacterium]
MELSLKDASNQELRTVQLSESVFGRRVRGDILAAMVNYQLAKRRSGTASSKGRSEIRGGGKKPYRQKGTGNARQGTVSAPQYRTGGVVFGPQPRDFGFKLTKKLRRLALLTALSAKRAAEEMVLIEDFGLTDIKTKAMKGILASLGVNGSALVVIAEEDRNVQLSARNLPGVTVLREEGVNTYDLLKHEKLVLTEAALQKLEGRLS